MSRTPRRGRRLLISFGLLCATVATFGLLVSQLWTAIGADQEFTVSERAGIAYLRPLTDLMGALGQAESLAVSGAKVDFATVTGAVAAVDKVESTSSERLHTIHRWSDLSHAIEKLGSTAPTGKAARDQYAEAMAMVLTLIAEVGDRSNLILDPELDSYYLMDVVLLRLPPVIVTSTRVLDETVLAGKDAAADVAVNVAVTTHQLGLLAGAISEDVRKASDATNRRELGPNLTASLDTFRSAVDRVAPPVALRPQSATWDDASLRQDVAAIRSAALKLASVAFTELDSLLGIRLDALNGQRYTTLILAGGGGVTVLLLLWASVPAPRERADDFDERGGNADHDDVALELATLEPRDILLTEELVHSGRSVHVRRSDGHHDQ